MALEIRQVVIRAEVEPQKGDAANGAQQESGQRGAQQENFVQEIVDQVLQVIDDRKAR